MDETGWQVGDQKCSLWAFASQLQRVFLFGRHKDDATLDKMLPPDVEELQRLLLAEELFTFVLAPEVEATNNLSERNLRSSAQDRKANRTNKTATGAHRRSVIVSVLESLRMNLKDFSLTTVLEEVTRWMQKGVSLFAKQWQAIRAAPQPVPG
jgi:hypothetical protein